MGCSVRNGGSRSEYHEDISTFVICCASPFEEDVFGGCMGRKYATVPRHWAGKGNFNYKDVIKLVLACAHYSKDECMRQHASLA